MPTPEAPAAAAAAPTKNTYHLVLYQFRNKNKRQDFIDFGTYDEVKRRLDREVKTPRETNEIVLWLESPGGDPHKAYKLVLELRSRADRLSVVVPDYAKSAATLIVLGMDKIYMGTAAELGPLDAQLSHPDREKERVSARDYVGSMEWIGRTALSMAIDVGAEFLEEVKLNRKDALDLFLKYSTECLKPVAEKIDPMLTHRAKGYLDVAERYAKELLKRRRLDSDARDQDGEGFDANLVCRHLVQDYTDHGTVIDREEAKAFGLPIFHAEGHPRWKFFRYIHRQKELEMRTAIMILTDQEVADIMDAPEKPTESDGTNQENNAGERPEAAA